VNGDAKPSVATDGGHVAGSAGSGSKNADKCDAYKSDAVIANKCNGDNANKSAAVIANKCNNANKNDAVIANKCNGDNANKSAAVIANKCNAYKDDADNANKSDAVSESFDFRPFSSISITSDVFEVDDDEVVYHEPKGQEHDDVIEVSPGTTST
jgi:hypothetical protein